MIRRSIGALAALLALATCAPPALAQTILPAPGCIVGVACQASSVAVGGATIGANAMAVTGAATFSSTVSGGAFLATGAGTGFQMSSTAVFIAQSRGVWSYPADGQWKCTNSAATAACSIIGTATNDNAVAGGIGEYISSSIPTGSAVTLTTGTAANVTSISLTAGDWEVCGNVVFIPGGTTTISSIIAWINTVSAAVPTDPGGGSYASLNASFATGNAQRLTAGCSRVSIASTTTVYLGAQSAFGVSTMQAAGFIGARRMR